MTILRWEEPETPPVAHLIDRPVSLAVGVFDGVHRGHQGLLQRAVTDAERLGHGVPAVLTFDPNPATIVYPESFPGILSTPEERLTLFKQFGIEEVIIVRFSPAFAVTPGPVFLQRILEIYPGLRLVVAGFNFHLGHNRDTGPRELTHQLATRGIRVDIVPALKDNEDSISSSRIRRAVATGDLEKAAALLGRQYRIFIAPGAHSNTCRPVQLLPPPGTYSCTLAGEGSSREGMMEISDEGILRWEPRITQIHYVIPRSRIKCL